MAQRVSHNGECCCAAPHYVCSVCYRECCWYSTTLGHSRLGRTHCISTTFVARIAVSHCIPKPYAYQRDCRRARMLLCALLCRMTCECCVLTTHYDVTRECCCCAYESTPYHIGYGVLFARASYAIRTSVCRPPIPCSAELRRDAGTVRLSCCSPAAANVRTRRHRHAAEQTRLPG